MFFKLYNGFLNFILPIKCLACGDIIVESPNFICGSCYNKLEPYNAVHPWHKEKISDGAIDNSLSVFWFREDTPIQSLFHALKYQKIKSAGIMLGEEIGKHIAGLTAEKFDVVVPVPLHKAKLRDRSYNQSEYIAKGIGGVLKLPVINNAVRRTRFTPTQTKLNKTQRRENVSGAFEVNNDKISDISGKNIILCDDVITTGATILECASALKKARCGKLWVCSAAYAELKVNVV